MTLKGLFVWLMTFGCAMCSRQEMWPECLSWAIAMIGFLLADKLYEKGEDNE